MSRGVAMALATLRRLAAASRPVIATRAISTAPVVVGGRPVLLFRPGPALLLPGDRYRGYARGRRPVQQDSDDEDFEEMVLDDEDIDDYLYGVISDDEYRLLRDKNMVMGEEPEETCGDGEPDSESE